MNATGKVDMWRCRYRGRDHAQVYLVCSLSVLKRLAAWTLFLATTVFSACDILGSFGEFLSELFDKLSVMKMCFCVSQSFLYLSHIRFSLSYLQLLSSWRITKCSKSVL